MENVRWIPPQEWWEGGDTGIWSFISNWMGWRSSLSTTFYMTRACSPGMRVVSRARFHAACSLLRQETCAKTSYLEHVGQIRGQFHESLFQKKTVSLETVSQKTVSCKTVSQKTVSRKTVSRKKISRKTVWRMTISRKINERQFHKRHFRIWTFLDYGIRDECHNPERSVSWSKECVPKGLNPDVK